MLIYQYHKIELSFMDDASENETEISMRKINTLQAARRPSSHIRFRSEMRYSTDQCEPISIAPH